MKNVIRALTRAKLESGASRFQSSLMSKDIVIMASKAPNCSVKFHTSKVDVDAFGVYKLDILLKCVAHVTHQLKIQGGV